MKKAKPTTWRPNSRLPAPEKGIARTKPPATKNRRRAALKFARNFHSKRRVQWVQRQPCAFCTSCDRVRNAHMNARGMGGCGGDYRRILPVCFDCDKAWGAGPETFMRKRRIDWDWIERELAAFNELWGRECTKAN